MPAGPCEAHAFFRSLAQAIAATSSFCPFCAATQSALRIAEPVQSQQQENLGVQKEFDSLSEDANIYKLVGPVLLKQDKTEAVLAVKGRLDYIEGEM